MDCPPDKENLKSFISVTEKLHNAKVNAPKLFDCDQENGFLVLSDLGDDLYSKKLDKETVYCLYTDALETIIKMQINTDLSLLIEELPESQKEVLRMRLFQDMSFKEIGDHTGVSINTALGRMRYAVINLRKMIEERNLIFTQ